MNNYPANQLGGRKDSRRRAIVIFAVASFSVVSIVLPVFAQSTGQSSGTTGTVTTSTLAFVSNPHIKNADDAQAQRNFLSGRLAWAQSHTELSSSVLAGAEYSQNQFETYLLQAGFTQALNGPITSPGQ